MALSTEEQSYLDRRPMKRLTFSGTDDLYLHPLFGSYTIKDCIEKETFSPNRYRQSVKPACYQDLLDGKPIFHKVGDQYLEIIPGRGRHCSTIAGDTFHMGWMWKGRDIGGGQAHLHLERYASSNAYRCATTGEPKLFVMEVPKEQQTLSPLIPVSLELECQNERCIDDFGCSSFG